MKVRHAQLTLTLTPTLFLTLFLTLTRQVKARHAQRLSEAAARLARPALAAALVKSSLQP